MQKKLARVSFSYAIIGMILGVFYREFTKFMHFDGITKLSVTHTHTLILGMFFFLIVLLLENVYKLSNDGKFKRFYVVYNIGLGSMLLMLIVRGITDVLYQTAVPKALDASISGLAGVAHIILAIGIVQFFLLLIRNVQKKENE